MRPYEERLKTLRHVVFDMDGTIYLDNELFDTTLPFLELLEAQQIGYTFITNNNSRSRREYAAHLEEMGIHARDDQIFSSAHGTLEYLSAHLPKVKKVFVLGTDGLVEDLEQGGLAIAEGQPDAVIVGFDRTLGYERLSQAAYWIKQGLPYVATHPDLICPTNLPTVLPDCGAVCALLEAATGRSPDFVPGKPSPAMIEGVMRSHGIQPTETAMIGDRIYTDMRMASDAGVLAVLTLTGEATAEQAAESTVKIDMIVSDLDDFSRQLMAARSCPTK